MSDSIWLHFDAAVKRLYPAGPRATFGCRKIGIASRVLWCGDGRLRRLRGSTSWRPMIGHHARAPAEADRLRRPRHQREERTQRREQTSDHQPCQNRWNRLEGDWSGNRRRCDDVRKYWDEIEHWVTSLSSEFASAQRDNTLRHATGRCRRLFTRPPGKVPVSTRTFERASAGCHDAATAR